MTNILGLEFIWFMVFVILIGGIPLDQHKEFTGDLLSFLHPYALLVGVLTVALFSMHGIIYVLLLDFQRKSKTRCYKLLRNCVKINELPNADTAPFTLSLNWDMPNS